MVQMDYYFYGEKILYFQMKLVKIYFQVFSRFNAIFLPLGILTFRLWKWTSQLSSRVAMFDVGPFGGKFQKFDPK